MSKCCQEQCSNSSLQGRFLNKFAILIRTGDTYPQIPSLGRLRKSNLYQSKKLLLRTQEAGKETQFSRHTCITCTVFWMGVLVKWTSTFLWGSLLQTQNHTSERKPIMIQILGMGTHLVLTLPSTAWTPTSSGRHQSDAAAFLPNHFSERPCLLF